MTRMILAAIVLLVSGLVNAQESNGPPSDRKLVEVKYLRGPRFNRVVELVNEFMHPGDARQYDLLNVILLRGAPERVALGEQLVKRFDVPMKTENGPTPSNYQLRIYLIEAG